jgi:hypothetical protein
LTGQGDATWRNIGPGSGGWIESITASAYHADEVFVDCDVGGFYQSEDADLAAEFPSAIAALPSHGRKHDPSPANDPSSDWPFPDALHQGRRMPRAGARKTIP